MPRQASMDRHRVGVLAGGVGRISGVRWVVGMVLGLGLGACATVAPGVRDSEAAARLDSVERAIEGGDPVGAREELDRVLASRPRAGAATRANMLDRELAARELEAFEPAFAQIAEGLERRDEE